MQESVWRDGVASAGHPRLERDLDVDVAIVGGGITGLTTALLLARAGKTVAVLEARRIGDGTTGGTSAHLTVALDQPLATLASRFGEEGARRAVESCRGAIDTIGGLCAGLGVDAEFQRVPAFRWAETPAHVPHLDDEARRYGEAGVLVHRQDGLPFSSLAVAALRFEEQAVFHPLRYLEGLAAAVVSSGAGHVFERTRVTRWDDGRPCRLRTSTGATVTAQEVVLATHSPIGLLVSLHTRLEPLTSYIIVARVDDPPPLGLYFDTAEPYHYVRAVSPARPDLLVIGGADTKHGHEPDTAACYTRLAEFARTRFSVRAIERRWSAILFESVDGLPFIGRLPGAQHVWVSTGYSGTGLTYGTVGAQLLSDLIQGHDNGWAELYSPSRVKPIASARRFVAENASNAYRWVADRLAPAPSDRGAGLPPGDGKLARVGGKKLALYRDPTGKLHAMSPKCTHSGCIVQWNQDDRTWDCPCHGGRFDAEGKVISGPPMADLRRVALDEEEPAPGEREERPAAAQPVQPEPERRGEVG
ncbi:MAG: FAD-dependent oxidoreductase [Planctomycetes bacterium]|nr:FAD-dependent oxidoreductase [Planctomycetota bacterium]